MKTSLIDDINILDFRHQNHNVTSTIYIPYSPYFYDDSASEGGKTKNNR